MKDIVFHIAVGVKDDGLSQDAGHTDLASMLQDRIESAILDVSWVTDLLVSVDNDKE